MSDRKPPAPPARSATKAEPDTEAKPKGQPTDDRQETETAAAPQNRPPPKP